MNKNFDFKDINLIPRLCIVKSRNECDTSVTFGKHKFKLPIYPANMESIINIELAEKFAENGYFYTMHRFLTTSQQIDFIKRMKDKNLLISISIGVNFDSYRLLEKLVERDLIPDFITVDIAHGHAIKMQEMLHNIKNSSINSFIIAGNISTIHAAENLQKWGADAVKVGIGPGAVCITAIQTGFGSRGMQASIVENIANSGLKIPIICDGGIKEHGDIAKALTLGATMVMAGNMFAGFEESPGEIITTTDKQYKQYWGSASNGTAGKTNRIEGKKTLIAYKNCSIFTELKSIEESLQSSISYAGGKTLDAFIETNYNII